MWVPRVYEFTGSASNGLGSPYTERCVDGKRRGGQSTGALAEEKFSPQDYNRDGPDPIRIVLPWVSLSAHMDGTAIQNCQVGGNVGISYTAAAYAIHAHPVNFREAPNEDTTIDGVLHFRYLWDSSDGVRAHLANCFIGEWTSYWENAGTYYAEERPDADQVPYYNYSPLVPPFGLSDGQGGHIGITLKNPMRGAPWRVATAPDMSDVHLMPPLVGPFPDSAGYVAQQRYGFHCDVCMGIDKGVFQRLMGPHPISRSLTRKDLWTFTYTVSKLWRTESIDVPAQ